MSRGKRSRHEDRRTTKYAASNALTWQTQGDFQVPTDPLNIETVKRLSMEELIRENRRIEANLTGLDA